MHTTARLVRTITAVIFLGASGLESSAVAEVVQFVVDPTVTQWSLRGAYFRNGIERGDFSAQTPGSDTASLSGVVRVDLTATTIQFLPGSVLTASVQPQPQQPAANGASGSAAANYGMAAPTLAAPTPVFAVRDFSFSMASPPISLVDHHSNPGDRQFNEDVEATLNVHIDFALGSSAGTVSRMNWNRGFDDDNVGTLTTSVMVQTLRLQNYLGDIFVLETPSDSFFEWAGSIVATRIVPEPAGWGLAAVSVMTGGIVACLRRRVAGPAQ